MYKIMILLNTFSSEISWPIFTKFHVNPTVETGLRVCSNGHAPLTVMPVYDKIMILKKTNKQKHILLLQTKTCLNDDPFIIVAMTGLEKFCITSAYMVKTFINLLL